MLSRQPGRQCPVASVVSCVCLHSGAQLQHVTPERGANLPLVFSLAAFFLSKTSVVRRSMVYKPTGVLNERKTDTGRNTWTTADNSDATSQQCWFCKFSALQTDKLAGVLYRVSVCRTFGGASAQPGCLYKVTDCQPAAPCDGWSRVAPPPGGVSSRFWLVSGSLAASSAC